MDLLNIIRENTSQQAWNWYEKSIKENREAFEEKKFFQNFSAVSRKLGNSFVNFSDDILKTWRIDELARAYFLFTINDIYKFEDIVKKCYDYGDVKEQSAVLKALSFFPKKKAFMPIALDASRTNITDTFMALICFNPFFSNNFEEKHFNKMVLKALFMELPIWSIYQIEEHINSDLATMCNEWIDEREAANRDFPPDIWLLVAPFAKQEQLRRVYKYLSFPNENHRYWVSYGLGLTKNTDHIEALHNQLQQESSEKIKQVIQQSIQKIQNTKGEK